MQAPTVSFDNDAILAIVRDIGTSAVPARDRARVFGLKYPEFAAAFPSLFAMATAPDFDLDRLIYMLELRGRIQAKDTTLDAASTEVGQKLFNVYVKDVVDGIPPS